MTQRAAPLWRSKAAPVLLVLALAGVAALRVASTLTVFSETADEHHLVAGVEWWDRGAYTYTIYHPPLARIASGLPLYLAGARAHDQWDIVAEKNAILYGGRGYVWNLAAARLGTLPFLLLAVAVVWLWARRLFGAAAGVVAVLLVTTLPPLLAHAGLATTDAPVTATLAAALFAFCLWLEAPTRARGALFGLWLGLALVTKFSALPFFLVAAVLILLLRAWLGRAPGPSDAAAAGWPRPLASLAIAALVAVLAIWAAYRFSWGVLPEQSGSRVRQVLSGQTAPPVAGTRVPAPEFFEGLRNLRSQMRDGHPAFLLGHYRRSGWWYYFPVALAVKTPLPFLLLAAGGAAAAARAAVRRRDWRLLAPVAGAAAILLTSLPSRIDIGVRHILPIYPMLAIAGGWGAVALWSRRGLVGRIAAAALLTWQVAGSARAHPDYLAWFNELAGAHPDRVLLDSNLDWGQDLYRLSDELRARHVDAVAVAYFGNADLSRHGLPLIRPLSPSAPTTGWIAISQMWLKDVGGEGKGYGWLREREPVARIGSSILLYYLAPPGLAPPGG